MAYITSVADRPVSVREIAEHQAISANKAISPALTEHI